MIHYQIVVLLVLNFCVSDSCHSLLVLRTARLSKTEVKQVELAQGNNESHGLKKNKTDLAILFQWAWPCRRHRFYFWCCDSRFCREGDQKIINFYLKTIIFLMFRREAHSTNAPVDTNARYTVTLTVASTNQITRIFLKEFLC